jgi:hypothetical protein
MTQLSLLDSAVAQPSGRRSTRRSSGQSPLFTPPGPSAKRARTSAGAAVARASRRARPALDSWAEHDDWQIAPEARADGRAHIAEIRARLARLRLASPAA